MHCWGHYSLTECHRLTKIWLALFAAFDPIDDTILITDLSAWFWISDCFKLVYVLIIFSLFPYQFSSHTYHCILMCVCRIWTKITYLLTYLYGVPQGSVLGRVLLVCILCSVPLLYLFLWTFVLAICNFSFLIRPRFSLSCPSVFDYTVNILTVSFCSKLVEIWQSENNWIHSFCGISCA